MCTESFNPGPVLRNIFQLVQPSLRPEFVRRLHGARVVMAHYELLQADFPQLASEALERRFRGIAGLSGPQRQWMERRLIDRWLLRNAALMSEVQTEQTEANRPITVGDRRFPVFRPPNYGRAVVSSLLQMRRARGEPRQGPRGLLDLKGTGRAPGEEPKRGVHDTGLLYLGVALSDLVHEELFTRLFAHARAPFQTLPTYAVIGCGFDAFFSDGSPTPAAIQVRRAHRRPVGGGDVPLPDSPLQKVKMEVEAVLRRYGVTSCTPSTSVHFRGQGEDMEIRIGNTWTSLSERAQRALPFLPGWRPDVPRYDGVNVQTTITQGSDPRAILVDFGQYSVPGRFDYPMLSLTTQRPFRWGGAEMRIRQPEPGLVPDLEIWGNVDKDAPEQPPGGPWTAMEIRCFELAEAWAEGRVSEGELRQELDSCLARGTRSWP